MAGSPLGPGPRRPALARPKVGQTRGQMPEIAENRPVSPSRCEFVPLLGPSRATRGRIREVSADLFTNLAPPSSHTGAGEVSASAWSTWSQRLPSHGRRVAIVRVQQVGACGARTCDDLVDPFLRLRHDTHPTRTHTYLTRGAICGTWVQMRQTWRDQGVPQLTQCRPAEATGHALAPAPVVGEAVFQRTDSHRSVVATRAFEIRRRHFDQYDGPRPNLSDDRIHEVAFLAGFDAEPVSATDERRHAEGGGSVPNSHPVTEDVRSWTTVDEKPDRGPIVGRRPPEAASRAPSPLAIMGEIRRQNWETVRNRGASAGARRSTGPQP